MEGVSSPCCHSPTSPPTRAPSCTQHHPCLVSPILTGTKAPTSAVTGHGRPRQGITGPVAVVAVTGRVRVSAGGLQGGWKLLSLSLLAGRGSHIQKNHVITTTVRTNSRIFWRDGWPLLVNSTHSATTHHHDHNAHQLLSGSPAPPSQLHTLPSALNPPTPSAGPAADQSVPAH